MSSSAFQNLVGMSVVLGAVSYGVGLLPLSVSLSKKQMSVLSSLGGGLLIGTAIGVILPEGIEQLMVHTKSEGSPYSFDIGIPILLGFALMFLLEEYAIPQRRSPAHCSTSRADGLGPIFDVELEERGRVPCPENPPLRQAESGTQRAFPLTFGLIIHALVDGYALGVSTSNVHSPSLSLIVFIAIIVHKAPTALALTTALLASSLSVADCKKHLLYFSLASPASSILTYGLHTFLSENRNDWSGSALLFSGGTFLYVTSVVQPVSGHTSQSPTNEIRKMFRVLLLLGGMFFPVLVSRLVVHAH